MNDDAVYRIYKDMLESLPHIAGGDNAVIIEKIVDGREDTETIEICTLTNISDEVAFLLSTLINTHTYDYCLTVIPDDKEEE